MPRDLAALKEDTLQGMPQLTKTPEEVVDDGAESGPSSAPMDAVDEARMFRSLMKRHNTAGGGGGMNSKRDEIHPYTQTLSLSDIESCILLEEATFPPEERCTREKFHYRLRHCGELSLGIFTSLTDSTVPTAATASPVYSGAPKRKSVLLGHIIATKTTNPTVKDEDMAVPSSSSSSSTPTVNPASESNSTSAPPSSPAAPRSGHKEEGRTLAIHSLAILPQYQRHGLGRTLLQAYLQRMESHAIGDRAALIAHEGLVPFYERFGFVNQGRSGVEFAGGGWWDMVRELEVGKEE
ncbi:hypothetical protein LTR91_022674 [Friedmanniomyces endolithicus]|uniref:N-acetyltransferase domain-containing protein n=1 Tax=Friedmanniomyces endolithicus TaxID=329885 RepID=A0AAN6H7T9_9PEZI|nr:hypothetical protein LTR94_019633 [Friedmanniomyces endolithicus]KAK0774841.1 hypothetical protein LTR38_016076 [Friedmanniomyces endolithicus]KAK0777474.1 hypothetical protein LTR75_015936 [Friedmanniomyces endolithicus]KAK0793687.1 hypothetical protein LTR59_008053 [Friedmanniomyces endolithicus]KAK0830216.1 hypothetical protein LTR03_015893 [Friedmanniomyces endolithicus]